MSIHEADITAISYRRATLSLRVPSRVPSRVAEESDGDPNHRAVAYVEVTVDVDGEEMTGVGEAAPLPAWGTETLDETLAFFAQLRAELDENDGTLSSAELLDDLELPAARFAIETAILDATAKVRGVPLRRLLNPDDAHDILPLNATIRTGTPKEAAEAALDAVEQGFGCLKVRVGSTTFDIDFDRLSAIREAVGSGPRLRIDAAGGWSAVYGLQFIDILADFDIDFVEQPCPASDIAGLGWLRQRSPVPIAAEESCHPFAQAMRLVEWGIVDVLVVKPMALGGLDRTLELGRIAREKEIGLVFGSSLASAVGRTAEAEVAAAIPEVAGACGFAGGERFTTEVADAPTTSDGVLKLGDSPGLGVVVDWSRLEDETTGG